MDNSKVFLPFVNEDISSAAPRPLTLEGPFLFVNETTSSPAFKLGGRQEIRSHVRKNAARQFQRNHKGDKGVGEKETKPTRYSPLAPQEAVDAGHKHTGCCDHSEGLIAGIPQSGSEHPKSFLATNESRDSSASAPAPESHISAEHSNANSTRPKTETHTLPFSPTISGYPTLQGDSQIFCPTCGLRISSTTKDEVERRGSSLVARRPTKRGVLNYSLVDGLGSGRVDPFLSYPVDKPTPKLHELMDHAITYLLPGLIPDGENHTVNPVSKAWFSTGLEHPLVFHALVFAGSIHLDFLRTSRIFPNSPQALSHKLVVIQKLKEIMNDPGKAQRDEVILAILVLSSHESTDPSRVRSNPFVSPLKNAQWLNIYGNIAYVPEHMKAVLDLITIRGGLEKLELHGLAETIAGGDVVSATQSLSRPILPPLRISETWIAAMMDWAVSPSRLPTPKLGRRFRDLQGYGVTENAIFVLDTISALTIAINHYLDGEPAGLSLGALSKIRTSVQHRLLSLPTADEINDLSPTQSIELNIYETCRLTAVIYGVAIIFPIPNSYNALQELVQRLKTSIEVCKVDRLAITLPDFLLWILVLGGIAALEKPQRPWYVAQLAKLAKKTDIYDWERIVEKLSHFLWLESACGPGGQRLWSETIERLYILDSCE